MFLLQRCGTADFLDLDLCFFLLCFQKTLTTKQRLGLLGTPGRQNIGLVFNPTIKSILTVNEFWSFLSFPCFRFSKYLFFVLYQLSSKTTSPSKMISLIVRLVYCKCQPIKYRSSHPEVFLEKGVLKIQSKFTGKHSSRSAISIKLLCTSYLALCIYFANLLCMGLLL